MKLSQCQWRIVKLVSEGLSNAEVAAAVGTTENVMKNYLRVIFDETGMSTRLELALWYIAIGEGLEKEAAPASR